MMTNAREKDAGGIVKRWLRKLDDDVAEKQEWRLSPWWQQAGPYVRQD